MRQPDTTLTRTRLIAGWVLVAAAGAVLVAGVGLLLSQPEELPEEAPTTFRFATEEFTNRTGGYSFRYPPDWKVDKGGTATQVESPDDNIVVTFGDAPAGGLRDAAGELLAGVVSGYDQVTLTGIEVRNIGGSFGALVGGSGVNQNGVPIRFLVIAIAAPEKNFGITVFAAADKDPQEVLPPVQEIVASFDPTGDA